MVTLSPSNNATPRAVNAVSSIASNTFSPPANSLIAACLACTNGAVAASSLGSSVGNNGSYIGAFTLGQTGIPGSSSTAVLLGGSDVTTDKSYGNPVGPITLEAWVKLTSSTGNGIITFAAPQSGVAWTNIDRQMYVGADGKVYFGIYNGSSIVALNSGATTVIDGSWHHTVAVLAANNNMSLYVDGTQVASNANISAPQNYTGWWRVGALQGNSTWPASGTSTGLMNGTIAHAAVYTAALSSATIAAHYTAGSTAGTSYDATVTSTSGLQDYWKLGDSSGTTAVNAVNPGLVFALLAKETANGADAEIWLAQCPSARTNMTVTAAFPSSQNLSLFILVFQNANTTQATNATSATTSASGAPSGTVTPTAAASYVFSVIANVTNTTAPTVAAGQLYSWNSITQETNDGTHSAWVQTAGGQGNSGQAVTVSDTAPAAIAYAMVTAEILSVASPAQLGGSFPASNRAALPTQSFLTQKLGLQSLNAFPVPSAGRIPGIV